MRHFFAHFASALVVLAAAACGGPVVSTRPVPPKEVLDARPRWFKEDAADAKYLLTKATAISADYQTAIDVAKADARADMLLQVEAWVKAGVYRFREQTSGTDTTVIISQFTTVSKAVATRVVSGLRTRHHDVVAEGGHFRAFVELELPVGEVARDLLERIRSSDVLRTQLRAEEAYRKLEHDVEQYDAELKGRRNPELP